MFTCGVLEYSGQDLLQGTDVQLRVNWNSKTSLSPRDNFSAVIKFTQPLAALAKLVTSGICAQPPNMYKFRLYSIRQRALYYVHYPTTRSVFVVLLQFS